MKHVHRFTLVEHLSYLGYGFLYEQIHVLYFACLFSEFSIFSCAYPNVIALHCSTHCSWEEFGWEAAVEVEAPLVSLTHCSVMLVHVGSSTH